MPKFLQTISLFICLTLFASITTFAQYSPIPKYGKALTCNYAPIAPANPSNQISVSGSTGNGTISNPWINWEDVLNAMPENSLINFEIGWYVRSKTITVKRGWKIRGKGIGLSNIISAPGASKVAFMANAPTNCSTAVNNVVEDLSILDNGQGGDVAYADVGGTFVDMNHVRVQGFKFGLILDQSELVTVRTNVFDEQSLGCVWVVNGDDFTPGNQRGFSNVIHLTDVNQFNPNPTGVGVIYDGGYTFSDVGNNHNGGKHYVWIAGAQTAVIGLCEMEGAAEDGIVTEYRTYFSQNSVGANYQVAIRDNVVVNLNAHNIRNGYFGILENNLISSRIASILCGWGVPGAQFQVGNLNSYGGPISGCQITDRAFFWLNTHDKLIQSNYVPLPSPSTIPEVPKMIDAKLDFTALRAGSCEELPVVGFANLKTTDFIQVSLPQEITTGSATTTRIPDSTSFNWWIKDAQTVMIRRCNLSRVHGSLDPPQSNVRVRVTP